MVDLQNDGTFNGSSLVRDGHHLFCTSSVSLVAITQTGSLRNLKNNIRNHVNQLNGLNARETVLWMCGVCGCGSIISSYSSDVRNYRFPVSGV